MSEEIILRHLQFMGFDWLDVMRAIDEKLQTQAARIAELEAALHKIADRTKRAHPQAQEGEIHHIAITVLTNNTQENING